MNSNDDNRRDAANPVERLEARETLVWPTAPMPLPPPADLDFLRGLPSSSRSGGVVWFDAHDRSIHGATDLPDALAEHRLREVLSRFQADATAWLRTLLPEYADSLVAQPATFRPEEEAFRSQTLSGRNDLLHIDHFPRRPTWGSRILRAFINVHPTEDRVWMLSEPFERILPMISHRLAVPSRTSSDWLREAKTLAGLLTGRPRSNYDAWMMRLRDALKADDGFQDRASRRVEHFGPGSAWLLFADATAHAVLRGQFALEQTWLVPVECLRHPELAPVNVLAAQAGEQSRRRAA